VVAAEAVVLAVGLELAVEMVALGL